MHVPEVHPYRKRTLSLSLFAQRRARTRGRFAYGAVILIGRPILKINNDGLTVRVYGTSSVPAGAASGYPGRDQCDSIYNYTSFHVTIISGGREKGDYANRAPVPLYTPVDSGARGPRSPALLDHGRFQPSVVRRDRRGTIRATLKPVAMLEIRTCALARQYDNRDGTFPCHRPRRSSSLHFSRTTEIQCRPPLVYNILSHLFTRRRFRRS